MKRKREDPEPAPPVVLSDAGARAALWGKPPLLRLADASSSGPSDGVLPPGTADLSVPEIVRAAETLVRQREAQRETVKARRERRARTWLAWSRRMPPDLSRTERAEAIFERTPERERPRDARAIAEYLRRNGQ